MKKLIVLIIVLTSVLSLFAGDWSFETLNSQSLFKESAFDQYAFLSQLGVIYFPKKDSDVKLRLSMAEKTSPEDIVYIDVSANEDHKSNMFIQAKLAEELGLAHFTFDNGKFPKIDGQIILKAYWNSLLNMDGSNQICGTDGSYLIGTEFKIADKLSLSVGLHHLSGHFGDEYLSDAMESNLFSQTSEKKANGEVEVKKTYIDKDGKEYVYYAPTEFVRDNEWLIGAAYDLPLGFRPYVKMAIPRKNAWIRPYIHTPSGNKYDIERIAWGESLPDHAENEGSLAAKVEKDLKEGIPYRALRLNAGFDWNMKFSSLFGVSAGFDVELNQDYMSKHMPNSFAKDNLWEFEYSAGASFELYNAINSKTMSINFIYHDGRLPLLNFYYIHTNTLYVGIGIH